MARPEKLLSAREVAAMKALGRYADGGGLYLEIAKGGRRSWIWRYRFAGKRRDMGLGSAEDVSLAEVRASRDRWRAILDVGRDPIEARNSAATEAPDKPAVTFGEIADQFIAERAPTWRNPKHRAQWKMTLEEYAKPLRGKPIAGITTTDILAVLKPHWQARPETASRLRGRIEMVIDAARVLGHIEEGKANPARWKGHLDKLLTRKVLSRGHHAAMPFADVPVFVASLRAEDSIGARALEFTILTASRTMEALLAQPGEFDFAEKVWTVPGARMKAGREHRVPLSARAVEIVEEMMREVPGLYIFPGARPKRPLSNMAFLMLLRRRKLDCTAHGFRSSFADWRGEATSFPKELAEAALAHIIGDATERAYRRGDALKRRRALMDAWAAFVGGASSAQVIPLRPRRKAT